MIGTWREFIQDPVTGERIEVTSYETGIDPAREKSLRESLIELNTLAHEIIHPMLARIARAYVKLGILKKEHVREKYRDFL